VIPRRAILECGGIDTALDWPAKAKAASRPPHSIKWRTFEGSHSGKKSEQHPQGHYHIDGNGYPGNGS
jgi:hypothetical protein